MSSMQQYYRPDKRYNVPNYVKKFINKSLETIKEIAQKNNFELTPAQEKRFKANICDHYNYAIHVSNRYRSISFKLLEVIPQQKGKVLYNVKIMETLNCGKRHSVYESILLKPNGERKGTLFAYGDRKERYTPNPFQF